MRRLHEKLAKIDFNCIRANNMYQYLQLINKGKLSLEAIKKIEEALIDGLPDLSASGPAKTPTPEEDKRRFNCEALTGSEPTYSDARTDGGLAEPVGKTESEPPCYSSIPPEIHPALKVSLREPEPTTVMKTRIKKLNWAKAKTIWKKLLKRPVTMDVTQDK
jgi:hypothetical protein